MTSSNEKIDLYGELKQNVTDHSDDINYHDTSGKFHSVRKGKIRWMRAGDQLFYSLPLHKGGSGYLVEVLAVSKQYVLAEEWAGAASNYYIYDFDGKVVVSEIKFAVPGFAQGRNKKKIDEIAVYFKECDELIKSMEENWQNKKYPTDNLHYFRCEGAPDQVKFIEMFDKLNSKK